MKTYRAFITEGALTKKAATAMSDKEALQKLDVLIKFFQDYNNMLSTIESGQDVRLAA